MTKAEQMIKEYLEKYENNEEDYYNPVRPIWLDRDTNFSFLLLLAPLIIIGVLYGIHRK